MATPAWWFSVNTAIAGMRITNVGAATTGGGKPWNHSLPQGNSVETRGKPD